MSMRSRFAPSPTGYLHLGHAYSALTAFAKSGHNPERFCLRIDDLDFTRCRAEYETALFEDLEFLGISWTSEPLRQSLRTSRYEEAFHTLKSQELIYPCYLSRKEVTGFLSAPHLPQTCAPRTKGSLSDDEIAGRIARGQHPVWRLDSHNALKRTGELTWCSDDGHHHPVDVASFGDVILGRRDIPYSYHLSVVLDDADSDIELVVRGQDLETSTPIHRMLQALLGLPSPCYHHHRLITDQNGQRLAKRNDALSLRTLRQAGASLSDLMALLTSYEDKHQTM